MISAVQLADAQPGPGGPAAAAARSRAATGRCRGWRFRWLRAGWAGRSSFRGCPAARARWPRRGGSAEPALARAAAAASCSVLVAGWLAGPLLNRLLGGVFALFNAGFDCGDGRSTARIGRRACCASACSSCCCYGGLLYLTYHGVRQHAPTGLHPFAGQGLPAGQRATARLDFGRAHPGT